MSVQGLKRLKVWARTMDFALKIYKEVLPLMPAEEKWALKQQLRRSTVSISSNIAEGYGRYNYQDNVRFCYIARGSLEEALSQIVFSHEIGYLPQSLYLELEKEGEELVRMLNGYIAYLKKSKQGANEAGTERSIREENEDYFVEPFDDFDRSQRTED